MMRVTDRAVVMGIGTVKGRLPAGSTGPGMPGRYGVTQRLKLPGFSDTVIFAPPL
jgi:hypothetical protein